VKREKVREASLDQSGMIDVEVSAASWRCLVLQLPSHRKGATLKKSTPAKIKTKFFSKFIAFNTHTHQHPSIDRKRRVLESFGAKQEKVREASLDCRDRCRSFRRTMAVSGSWIVQTQESATLDVGSNNHQDGSNFSFFHTFLLVCPSGSRFFHGFPALSLVFLVLSLV
jgi:hypothetical protein